MIPPSAPSAIYLSRLVVYPVKSLDGWEVSEVTITPGGTLTHDRRWAICATGEPPDSPRRFVNGKTNPRIHRIRCQFSPDGRWITVGLGDDPGAIDPRLRFELVPGSSPFTDWLEPVLGLPVYLQENPHQGFPDDLESYGPTLISQASLETVAQWFPGQTLEQMRGRFRVNGELRAGYPSPQGEILPASPDLPPFWEDQLVGPPGTIVPFHLGSIAFEGTNPCKRCVVPTRDPHTGTPWPQFQTQFSHHRQATLPPWAVGDRFRNPYRLSLNTRIPPRESGKVLRVGDLLTFNS